MWLPTNYVLILALEKFNRFLGDGFTVDAPGLAAHKLTLKEVVDRLARRMCNLYRPCPTGSMPAFADDSPWQRDSRWRHYLQFYEYFHGDTGQGLGAAHQTGWTGLLANLVMRCHGHGIAGLAIDDGFAGDDPAGGGSTTTLSGT